MRIRNTLQQLIVEILSKSKTGLVNSEISKAVLRRRSVALASIDSTLSIASKSGVIQKKPVIGQGKSKFVYSVEKEPSVRKIIAEALTSSDRVDSQEVLTIVRTIRPGATAANVSSTLSAMAKKGQIIMSKTLMTDTNVTSDASKYVYTGIKAK